MAKRRRAGRKERRKRRIGRRGSSTVADPTLLPVSPRGAAPLTVLRVSVACKRVLMKPAVRHRVHAVLFAIVCSPPFA
eukprot:2193090-Pyramimonas_sp.AAC.1